MKKVTLIMVMIFAISLVNAQTETKKAPVKKKNGPEITFKNVLHDYGTIYVGSDGSYEFEFTNTGNEPLILSRPRSSCGCTVPTWPKEPILPGETNKIKVTYNTHKPGPFNKSVTIYSNANKVVVLRIKGKVVKKPAEALPEKENAAGASPVNK
jgi:hypothetical protein